MTDPEIVVLRKETEGLSTANYAEAIQERLPEKEVAHARTPYQERDFINKARVATGISVDEELVEHTDNLELFVVAASGYNHIPMKLLINQGAFVANGSGIHAPGIAEQALDCCLMFARQLHEGWTRKRRSEWRHYKPGEFTGSTVTVVGLGVIGTEFIKKLQDMDTHTIGVRYSPEKGGPTDEVVGFDDEDFHEALSRTDYLILSTPLTETTRGLMRKEEFATLPPSSVLVNVCRGDVVDTDALLSATQKESIRGAAMDVTEPEPLPKEHPL